MVMESTTVALVGIGVAFGISLLAAIVFLILYARLKIKDDTNIRRRVIAASPMEAKASLIRTREPEMIDEFIEPLPQPSRPPPVVYPAPVPIPAPPRPPPPQQQIFVIEPTPQPPPPPPPQPLPPPREPEVVIHEVIHRYQPEPQAPPPPPPQERVVRRRSWGGPQDPEDDWVLVKRITKNSGKKSAKVRHESSDESSDEEETKVKRRHHKKRLDRYDLATSVIPMGFRPQPQMMQSGGYMMPTAMMAPSMMAQPMMTQAATMMTQPMMTQAATMMAQPMMAATQPTYMPFFTVPR